jgi:hypothetical protein
LPYTSSATDACMSSLKAMRILRRFGGPEKGRIGTATRVGQMWVDEVQLGACRSMHWCKPGQLAKLLLRWLAWRVDLLLCCFLDAGVIMPGDCIFILLPLAVARQRVTQWAWAAIVSADWVALILLWEAPTHTKKLKWWSNKIFVPTAKCSRPLFYAYCLHAGFTFTKFFYIHYQSKQHHVWEDSNLYFTVLLFSACEVIGKILCPETPCICIHLVL